MILSPTAAEIEALKRKRPKAGSLLEKFKREMEETANLHGKKNKCGPRVVGGPINKTKVMPSERENELSEVRTWS